MRIHSWPEHNLNAVVLFVSKDLITVGSLLQGQVMCNDKGGINLARLDAPE